jgi:hypothetical protein
MKLYSQGIEKGVALFYIIGEYLKEGHERTVVLCEEFWCIVCGIL